MKGQPPAVFNGNRSKTNQFMTEFQLWWMINNRSESMTIPFERIALCLSFIRGPDVDNWVAEKINQLRLAVRGDPARNINPTYNETDEALWNAFGADFRQSFQDTAEEENAYAALKDLRMKEDQIDGYIAHFEVLLVKAGWQRTERGSADLFFNGLTKRVQSKILSLYTLLPTTLDEWQAAARSIVQRQRLMDVKLGPWKPREQKQSQRSGRNPKGQFKKTRDPNAMDVDTADINLASTDEKGERKKKAVECYYCHNLGHVKADCRKFKAAQGKETHSQKAKARATTVESDDEEEEKEVPPAYKPDSLMVHINSMKIEDRNDFLDRLLIQDNEGF